MILLPTRSMWRIGTILSSMRVTAGLGLERISYLIGSFVMRRLYDAILWLFLAPGDLIADRLGVTKDENRDLVRMLVNGLFWIGVAVVGLAIWTSTLPIYR